MPCDESLRVQALFDGELDAIRAAEVERHCEACAECRELCNDLKQVRIALRQDSTYETAPSALRARIMRALDGASAANGSQAAANKALADWRSRPFWNGVFSAIGGTAIAAGLVFLFLAPPASNLLLNDLVSAHVRSLMPDHLIDVASTDRHTVKPWFAGHADVSPVVADFAQQGYRLVGGRADYLDHQRAAVVVYRHGAHVINVFSWAGAKGGRPKHITRDGYHLSCWSAGNLVYCAVSDTGWDELDRLVRLLQNFDAHDNRE